ncbi:MAG: glutathione S-transferase family protein [Nannocystales bacterium]
MSAPITVYAFSGAPRPWRVLLALAVKRLPHTVRWLSVSNQEHRTAQMLRLNPRARLPVLVNGEDVVTESLAILAYLDALEPEPPLWGRTPAHTGAVWRQVLDADEFLRDAADAFLSLVFRGSSGDEPAFLEAAENMLGELHRLETRLRTGPFVCGSVLTAADLVVFPEVRLVVRAAEKNPAAMRAVGLDDLREPFPLLHAWVAQLEGIPGYAATFPTHWNQP